MFLTVSCAVLMLVVVLQLRFVKREKRLRVESWDALLTKLQPLEVDSLQEIADCYLRPTEKQLRIEPGSMWEAVGGAEGLKRLSANADIMLDLAMYAERWNDVNGRVISELLRRDASRLRTCIRKLEVSLITRYELYHLGFELQEAIVSYCLMRARLLGMYAECHMGLFHKLSEAV